MIAIRCALNLLSHSPIIPFFFASLFLFPSISLSPSHSFPLFPSLFLSFFLTLTLFFHLFFPFSFTLLLLVSFRFLTFFASQDLTCSFTLSLFTSIYPSFFLHLLLSFPLSFSFPRSLKPVFSRLISVFINEDLIRTVKYISNTWKIHNLSFFLSQISSL